MSINRTQNTFRSHYTI